MARSRLASVLLAFACLSAFCVLIGLGVWQMQRLAWKEALIAAVEERPLRPAVAAPGPATWATFDLDQWNYARVTLKGRFGPEEALAWTALSDARGPLSGSGYFVVAPFTTDEGWSVLVNRGFVPEAKKLAEARPDSRPPEGEATIEGLIRRDDPPSFITPSPDFATKTWFTRHISSMVQFFGLQRALVAPYSIDLLAEATPPGGLPQAGESRMTFANSHLQYALTWFGLAAALLGVVGVALWRRRSDRQ